MASKLYPPILEASIPAFYGTKVIIPFQHNSLVSKAEIKGYKIEVKRVSGELIGIYDGSINEENVVVCNINYKDLYSSYSDDLDEDAKNKLLQANWYKFSIAYVSNDSSQIGYYSTAAIGRFLGPIAPTVELAISSMKCNAIYSHPYDKTEKAYSYRFILKRLGINGLSELIIEDTGEQIHNINEDKSADKSVDVFDFTYYIPAETGAQYELFYTLTTINNFVIEKKISVGQTMLSGVPVSSFDQKEMFEIEAILNRDNGTIELWAYPNQNLETITGWFKVWRSSSKDDHKRLTLISTFALVETKTQKDGGPIKILLTTDKMIEAGYYYRYFIQQYNQYGIASEVISTMKDGKAVYMSYDDCFLWDGERQLRIKFNPKVSSFKANILQTKSETIGSKYPFITRNGVVNYKEFPISGLISFQMDENELFMTREDKERLGILPDLSMRGELQPQYDGKDSIRFAEFTRHRRKNLERGNEINLVDINVNAEKDFKLEVLNFLNNNKPKLFRSATEGMYVVYTMNSSLTPTDALGRMLHTFNCTAYECEAVEDFYKRFINDTIYCYDSNNQYINLLDLSDLKTYQKIKQVPYIPKDAKTDEEIFSAMIDQRLLDIDEYARNFYVRDAKPLQEFKISFVDIFNPTREISDQTITIGATGSYNYFCTDTNVYIKYIWPLYKNGERGLTHPSTITFRNLIRIPVTDFDFLEGTFAITEMAKTFQIKDTANNEDIWHNQGGANIYTYDTDKSTELYTLINSFQETMPLSLYTSSSFKNNTFERIENIIEDIYLLRAFNTDIYYDHPVVFTLGNGFSIYRELASLFTHGLDSMQFMLYELKIKNPGYFETRLLRDVSNIEKEYNKTYYVSKSFYQFCRQMSFGRYENEIAPETSIFIFKTMKIEDKVKYMSQIGHENAFVDYEIKFDYDSHKDQTIKEFITLVQTILIQILQKIKTHQTKRIIPPNGTMALAVEVPNIMDFCVWKNESGEFNNKILFELTAQSRQNVYNFNDIKKTWEVYKENAV